MEYTKRMYRGVKSVLLNFCRECLGVINFETHATHGRMASTNIIKLYFEVYGNDLFVRGGL